MKTFHFIYWFVMGCFYDKGLQFSCQGCSYCCGTEPGYVFLSELDRKAIADHLGLSIDAFMNTYCRKIDMGSFYMVSLLEKKNYDCIFLQEKGCSIYPVRPLQCRTYPFWSNIMESNKTWEKEALSCPGIGKGKIHSKQEIEQTLEAKLLNPPLVIFK